MKKNRVSIKKKLILLCLSILIVPSLLIGLVAYNISHSELDTAGKSQLKKSTKMVIGMIDILNKDVEAGILTKAEAQEQLRQELFGDKDADGKRQIKDEFAFGQGGYVWAIDNKGTYVLSPESDGVNIYNHKTDDGIMIAQEAIKKGEKGDFLTYQWENIHNSNKVEEKVSYVEKDPHWGWTIASSAYMAEFNTPAKQIAILVTVITGIAVILGALLAYYYASKLTNPINRVANELKRASEGDLSGEELKVISNDEIGELTKDFNKMKANMRELLSHINQSTEHVAAASEQLSASAEETSKATEDITQSIQQIAAASEDTTTGLTESSQSLEEVTIAIQNLAENSAEISEAGTVISNQAKQGNIYVEQTVKQMNSIHHQGK